MIKFLGEVSNKCKKHMKKQYAIVNLFCFLFAVSIVGVFFIVLEPMAFLFIMLPMICVGGPLFIFLVPHETVKIGAPREVIIEVDYLSSEGKGDAHIRYPIDVKKVIDRGEWYDIVFYFPHKSLNFKCQKDLIIHGTIEEFEKMFEGKIVRK